MIGDIGVIRTTDSRRRASRRINATPDIPFSMDGTPGIETMHQPFRGGPVPYNPYQHPRIARKGPVATSQTHTDSSFREVEIDTEDVTTSRIDQQESSSLIQFPVRSARLEGYIQQRTSMNESEHLQRKHTSSSLASSHQSGTRGQSVSSENIGRNFRESNMDNTSTTNPTSFADVVGPGRWADSQMGFKRLPAIKHEQKDNDEVGVIYGTYQFQTPNSLFSGLHENSMDAPNESETNDSELEDAGEEKNKSVDSASIHHSEQSSESPRSVTPHAREDMDSTTEVDAGTEPDNSRASEDDSDLLDPDDEEISDRFHSQADEADGNTSDPRRTGTETSSGSGEEVDGSEAAAGTCIYGLSDHGGENSCICMFQSRMFPQLTNGCTIKMRCSTPISHCDANPVRFRTTRLTQRVYSSTLTDGGSSCFIR